MTRNCTSDAGPGEINRACPPDMNETRLPQSSKKVMKILDCGCPMTQKDLVKKTRLHPRTVRYALKKLKERKLLIEKLKMDDLRQIMYQIRLRGVQEPSVVQI